MATSKRRPIRIAGCSGSASDRRDALLKLASNHLIDRLDGIVGDWLSEANMTSRGASKVVNPDIAAYEASFLESLESAMTCLSQNQIKLVVNAGASDTEKLYSAVMDLIQERDIQLNVAWISGDEVLSIVKKSMKNGSLKFEDLDSGKNLDDWAFEPLYAQAYLGSRGIAAALSSGADIVLCGRVSDAALLMGLAIWWHDWPCTRLDCLANTLIAGHLIECSSYACGGNFSGFRTLNPTEWTDIGYPIAEVSRDGEIILTKSALSGGELNINTVTAQLLYEIQGPYYLNSDVVADISKIQFEQLQVDRVAVHGVQGLPPPSTTKVGITALGGFQAEIHWFIVGLDVSTKASMLEAQIRHAIAPHIGNFSVLDFTLTGTSAENPTSQTSATVIFRVLAQARRKDDLKPSKFARPITNLIMTTYPGATYHLDLRMGFPRPIYEYFVTSLPQTAVQHKAHLPWIAPSEKPCIITIAPPTECTAYEARQPTIPMTSLDSVSTLRAFGGIYDAAAGWAELPAKEGRSILRETHGPWGRTIRGPLGWLVHARSGDKGSNANVGFWVPGCDKEKWDWLRSLLSTRKMRELLGDEFVLSRKRQPLGYKNVDDTEQWIDRFEFPRIRAVHFLLRQHLDRGVSCTRSFDFLGKNVAEFLRARWVDLPVSFLDKGKL